MLHIFKTTDDVLMALANYFVKLATEAIDTKDSFSVALSGGSSPKKLYELLASPAYNGQVKWNKVYFFFGDERDVPYTSPDSNALMVQKALFDPLNIPTSNIFKVNTILKPDEAAESYTNVINQFYKGEEVKFDLVLLGLGDNSHTASLFPYTDVLHDTTASVKAVFLSDQQIYRITFTAPLINRAHHIAFLVYGQAKAEAVRHVLEDNTNFEEYPAQLISKSGDMHWFLDEASASMLSSK